MKRSPRIGGFSRIRPASAAATPVLAMEKSAEAVSARIVVVAGKGRTRSRAHVVGTGLCAAGLSGVRHRAGRVGHEVQKLARQAAVEGDDVRTRCRRTLTSTIGRRTSAPLPCRRTQADVHCRRTTTKRPARAARRFADHLSFYFASASAFHTADGRFIAADG
jgi:hypothetical protein